MNSDAQSGHGVALDISLPIRHWFGRHDSTVVSLDDFNLLLGIDFMRKFKNPSFVKAIHPYGEEKKNTGIIALLSASAFEKSLKRGESAYLAALIDVKPNVQMEIPDCVAELLKEFVDVMPLALPKALPPKREIDHMIELIPGSVPSPRPPYRMALFKFV